MVVLPRKHSGQWRVLVEGWACEKWEDLQREKICRTGRHGDLAEHLNQWDIDLLLY